MSRNDSSPQPESELRQLISDQCSGTLSSEGQVRLESMLTASEDARKFYLLYTAVHARLRRRFRGHGKEMAALTLEPADEESVAASADEHGIARAAQSECENAQTESNTTHKPSTNSTRAIYFLRSRPGLLSLAIAALVMCLMVTAMAFMSPPFFRALTKNHESRPAGRYDIVAEITGLHEADLRDANDNPHHGTFLAPGRQLHVKKGLVQIAYHTGALVVLEGPASYTIQGTNGGDLQHGKLVARISTSEALGFVVDIPGARIIDLGTEFGVDVADGKADVAVLTGEVELVGKAHGAAAGHRLVANDSASVDALHGTIVRRANGDGPLLAAMRLRLERLGQPLSRRRLLVHSGLEKTAAADGVAPGLTASRIRIDVGGISSMGAPEGKHSHFIWSDETGSENPPTVSDIHATWTFTPEPGMQIALDSVTWQVRTHSQGPFNFHTKLFVSSEPDFSNILAESDVFTAVRHKGGRLSPIVAATLNAELTSGKPLYFGLAFTDDDDSKSNGRFDAIYVKGSVSPASN